MDVCHESPTNYSLFVLDGGIFFRTFRLINLEKAAVREICNLTFY